MSLTIETKIYVCICIKEKKKKSTITQAEKEHLYYPHVKQLLKAFAKFMSKKKYLPSNAGDPLQDHYL